MQTLTEILCDSVSTHGHRVAFQTYRPHGEVSGVTRHEVAARAGGLADVLHERGIGKGSHVALLAGNSPRWGAAYFGILLTGAALVPLDVKLKGGEIANILRRCGAALLLAGADQEDKARSAAAGLCEVLPTEGDARAADADDQALTRVVSRHSPRRDDLAVISFTSGTTGRPKGIMLTHANIVSNVMATAKVMEFGPDDNFLSVLPLNHLFEQTLGMVVPFHGGARVTYTQSLNPRILVEAMHHTETTLSIIVPAVARLFRKRITAAIDQLPAWKRTMTRAMYRLSRAADRWGVPIGPVLLRGVRKGLGRRMRILYCGGAALDDDAAGFFKHIGLPIMQGYGLSETSPLVAVNTRTHGRLGSVGKPIEKVAVRIDPIDGCAEGTGEILVSGPNVMTGYFQDAQASEAVLEDGWFRTGDIGRLDDDGFLYITGRCKDVIISESGKNVYPNEIEAEISRYLDVGDVCVVGLPTEAQPGRGEEIVVVVTPPAPGEAGGGPEDLAEAVRTGIRAARNALADYKRPKYFVIWQGDLPRTATLKVKKHQLVELLDRDMLLPL